MTAPVQVGGSSSSGLLRDENGVQISTGIDDARNSRDAMTPGPIHREQSDGALNSRDAVTPVSQNHWHCIASLYYNSTMKYLIGVKTRSSRSEILAIVGSKILEFVAE